VLYDAEGDFDRTATGSAFNLKAPSFQLDLLDTTLVARTVEDRGRQWNAEKPYRS
jgi:hypothetical protein